MHAESMRDLVRACILAAHMQTDRQSAIPYFVLGTGRTPVPQISAEEAKTIVRHILHDEAISQGRGKPAVGAHVTYQGRQRRWRRSDRVERIYASVRILMRAGQSQAQACRCIADLPGFILGTSKRGRPSSRADNRRGEPWRTVRSLFNNFNRRNPFANEDSAQFVDAITEKWFQHGLVLWRLDSGQMSGLWAIEGWAASGLLSPVGNVPEPS
jgi:hypothetical protein